MEIRDSIDLLAPAAAQKEKVLSKVVQKAKEKKAAVTVSGMEVADGDN